MRAFLFGALLLLGFFAASLPTETFAASIVPCGRDVNDMCETCHFVQLGSSILNWIIGIMATVCAVIIAVAGLKMATAGGNAGKVSEAKGMITNTIVGFIILLAAWLIVDTVLRVFVSGSDSGDGAAVIPGFGPWNEIECVDQPEVAPPPPPGEVVPAPTACTVPVLTPITDPLALQMEAGQTIVWNNPTLQACVNRFIGQVGGSVESAYRPPSYQTHLYEIRDRWCLQGLRTNTTQVCSAVRADVERHVNQHFGGDARWQCGAVGRTSTHSSGNGVDITGVTHSDPVTQRIARDNCLVWRNYPNDAVHYDLISDCTCN